jgi:hypothetical protein
MSDREKRNFKSESTLWESTLHDNLVTILSCAEEASIE